MAAPRWLVKPVENSTYVIFADNQRPGHMWFVPAISGFNVTSRLVNWKSGRSAAFPADGDLRNVTSLATLGTFTPTTYTGLTESIMLDILAGTAPLGD